MLTMLPVDVKPMYNMAVAGLLNSYKSYRDES